MGKKKRQFKVENLSRFLIYILGRRPHEFGLVPSGDGFVPSKELLQAIHEEPGWGYVRQSHINEVLMGKDRPLFETRGRRIRAVQRRWDLDLQTPAPALPGILFTPIRRRAHPVVMEKGLIPGNDQPLVFSPQKDMAIRIGRRRDQQPVVLEIMANGAQAQGVCFYPFGELFVCPQIPVRFIAGPPVPKEVLERRKEVPLPKPRSEPGPAAVTPGTFTLDTTRDPDLQRRTKGKKVKGWKEAARKVRRGKRR